MDQRVEMPYDETESRRMISGSPQEPTERIKSMFEFGRRDLARGAGAPLAWVCALFLAVAVGCGGGAPPSADDTECETESDCAPNEDCIAGECKESRECTIDSECEFGEECVMGSCEPETGSDTGDIGDTGPGNDCSGCLLATGEGDEVCVDGNEDEACGRGGVACTECRSDEYCDEGECVPANCTSESCAGCCLDDECHEGNTDEACGSGAETCETCSEDATCREQSCQLPCPQSCAGCCDEEGTCLDGSSSETCGTNGEQCQSCGEGKECRGGSCVEATCDSSTCSGCCGADECKEGTADDACGRAGEACVECKPGFSCRERPTGGACVLRDDSNWRVIGVRGKVPESRMVYTQYGPMEQSWDSFSDPDPYLEVTVEDEGETVTGETETADNDTEPTWNDETVAGVLASSLKKSENVTFAIYDDDFGVDQLIAECDKSFNSGQFDGLAHEFECKETHAEEEITAKIWLRLKPN